MQEKHKSWESMTDYVHSIYEFNFFFFTFRIIESSMHTVKVFQVIKMSFFRQICVAISP